MEGLVCIPFNLNTICSQTQKPLAKKTIAAPKNALNVEWTVYANINDTAYRTLCRNNNGENRLAPPWIGMP
jgi:hypothetical protein